MSDNVNHPPHYQDLTNCDHCKNPIECINISRNFNFNLGNVIKYIWRADKKDNRLEQLQKAQWYLEDEIKKYFPLPISSKLTTSEVESLEEEDIDSGAFLPLGHEIYFRNCKQCSLSPVCRKTNKETNSWSVLLCKCYFPLDMDKECVTHWFNSSRLQYLEKKWDEINVGY